MIDFLTLTEIDEGFLRGCFEELMKRSIDDRIVFVTTLCYQIIQKSHGKQVC